ITNRSPRTFYWDKDRDGYGNNYKKITASYAPKYFVGNNQDCNDQDANIHPNTLWFADRDGDGFGNSSSTFKGCSPPSGENYVRSGGDYNDNNSYITNIPPKTYYRDADGDGEGIAHLRRTSSTRPAGYVENALDCNDSNRKLHSKSKWLPDRDGDGMPATGNVVISCSQPKGYMLVEHTAPGARDCDDNNPKIGRHPNWYIDRDKDGFGDPNGPPVVFLACKAPSGYVGNALDCNDNDKNIHPNTLWYADQDKDGFGDPNTKVTGCKPKDGYVQNSKDVCPLEFGKNNGCPVIEAKAYTPPTLSNENYIYTKTYQIPTTTGAIDKQKDVMEQVAYFDGLGRPMQNIAIKASPQMKDMVTYIGYDALGRQDKDWLPIAFSNGKSGAYRGDIRSQIQQYYKNQYPNDFVGVALNQVNAYSQKEFEASPLNRVLKQAAPGKDWALGAGHEIEFDYQTNSKAEVVRFDVHTQQVGQKYIPQLKRNGYYLAATLYKTITFDENHQGNTKDHSTEEFKNKQGQVILKRTYNKETPHDTYYVYDDYGNLTYVIPPKVTPENGVDDQELKNLCYQYVYDHRNRLIEKQIPGKGWEFIVYDLLDRPVMTKDAINDWLFTKYDVFGRVVYTGKYKGKETRKQLQQIFNDKQKNPKTNYETKVTTGTGYQNSYYTNAHFPSANIEILTLNYYDNYSFDKAGAPASITAYGVSSTTNTKTLATGSKVKVLDVSPAKWITTVTYYDEKARPIYVYAKNDYLGTIDIVQTELDFTGKTIQTQSSHTKDSKPAIIVKDQFTYDHSARLLKQTQQIANQQKEVLVQNTYDALGELKGKGVGGKTNQNRLQNISYTYNIRGWLTGINDVKQNPNPNKLFNFSLSYNSGTNPLYNGNISETHWRTANSDSSLKSYAYSYDALNRITAATDNTGKYNLSGITYDKMGNILSLIRKGHTNV
ncbi:MAG: DUF6443 domain-containing protein, partial [Flavobacteriaceae bacterium]|nr:DUF6443 domain-containing protein [Flavobacteriaceae bacterium]